MLVNWKLQQEMMVQCCLKSIGQARIIETQARFLSYSLESESFYKRKSQGLLLRPAANWMRPITLLGLPGGSDGKESACNAGDPGLMPELGRSTGEGNGNPLQYSCLENPMDRGAWWATVCGVTKSQT